MARSTFKNESRGILLMEKEGLEWMQRELSLTQPSDARLKL